jgi:putative YhdH/YhfP family quinone oxidoreductase
VLVTGATGGVGSLAIDMLSARGYQVVALTSKPQHATYLHAIGATEVMPRAQLPPAGAALASARWAGAIDNLGGEPLGAVLAAITPLGNVASIGLAAGATLHTTVMPFILRGVNLLGVNSSGLPRAARLAVWQRIGGDLRPRHLATIVTRTLDLAELPGAFADYLAGRVCGRTVVRIP